MKRITLLFTFLFTIFFLVNSVFATIIEIPNDYGTIQQGIDSSAVGDTVLVQPGTYVENINFNGKNITLASLYLTTQDTAYISETIIDGDSSGSVVTFENGEDSTAILSGFTLTNGYNEDGGGIYCNNSSPSLFNLIITRNYTIGDYSRGGGIYLYSYSNPKLVNVSVINNYADYEGGGIYCRYSHPSLNNLKISNNLANSGAGIYFTHCNPSLENVVISFNSAIWSGGGIYCSHTTNPDLDKVTISNNSSDNGGGIFCWDNSNPSLTNSILWDNFPQEVYFHNTREPNSITIRYSDVDLYSGGINTNNNGTLYWLDGNISNDPLFLDPTNGNYRLTYESPCIDAGDPNSPLDPDGTITDMGAYYYNQSETIWPGDTNYDGYVDEADIDAIAIYWREQGTPRDTVSFAWQSFSRPLDWEEQIASMADCNGDGEVNITDVLAICLNWHYTHENTASQIILPENITDYRENFIEVYNSLGNSQVEIKMKNHIAVIFDLPLISNVESRLYQNSPNPFRNETRINFSLKPEVEKAPIEIFNIKGQLVREIIVDADNSQENSVTWDGKDDAGNSVSSGVYFFRLKQDEQVIEIKKALKIR